MTKGSYGFTSGNSWHELPQPLQYKRFDNFNLSRDLKWPRDQRAKWFYVWEAFMISHHSATLDKLRHSGSRDAMIAVCLINLQYRVIKRSCDIMEWSPSRQFTALKSFIKVIFNNHWNSLRNGLNEKNGKNYVKTKRKY